MAVRDYIPIEIDNIPELFEIDLAGRSYLFGINYAASEDIYSVDLYDINEVPIILGEKLVLNERLWNDFVNDQLPPIDIVPLDESGKEQCITKENFMKTVFLYVDDLSDEVQNPSLDNEVG